jgi:methylenetetrahydrofolate reductase (NADPH)
LYGETLMTLTEARARCPKRMYHGPCGGVRAGGGCEVDARLPCPYLQLTDTLPWRRPVVVADQRTHSAGRLEQALRAGELVTIAEVYTPDSADLSRLLESYLPLKPHITAVNIAEHALATPHASTLAAAALFERAGLEAIINLTCRDRNRIALQGEILGAAALGVNNLFCITGDHPARGDHPEAQAVFDLDALELIALVRRLRDDGTLLSGRPLTERPRLFIGAAANPFSPPVVLQAERVAAKVAQGANFIQTQAMFDVVGLAQFTAELAAFGVFEAAYLIVGVALVTSLTQALWLKREVPGARVPDTLLRQLERLSPREQRRFGLKYADNLMAQLASQPHVSGVLLFPLHGDLQALYELLLC